MTTHLHHPIAPMAFHALDQALVIQLHAEGRQMMAERDAKQRQIEHLELELDVMKEQRDARGAKLNKAVDALARYGRHDRECTRAGNSILPGDEKCTCGLSKVAAEVEP